jgi:hypothetical protein
MLAPGTDVRALAVPIAILRVFHPTHSPTYLTGGSGVRDMVDPNWVKNVFQII